MPGVAAFLVLALFFFFAPLPLQAQALGPENAEALDRQANQLFH